MDVEITLRELDAAQRRLKNQQQLLAISQTVSDKAIADGAHALARMANTRLRRQKDAIEETQTVIAQLTALLPPPPGALNLDPPKKGR